MWDVLIVEFLISLCIIYFLYKYKCPSNIILIIAGVLLSVITGTLYAMHIDVAYITTGISGGALILEGVRNKLAKEDNLKTSGDWRKNLYKLEQSKDYNIKDLYELNSYINPYSNENVVSIIVNQVIVDILSGYSKSEKIRVEEFNEELYKKENLQRERNKITSKEYEREQIWRYIAVILGCSSLIILLIILTPIVLALLKPICECYFRSVRTWIGIGVEIAVIAVIVIIFFISRHLAKKKVCKEISEINKEIDDVKDDNTIKKYDNNKEIDDVKDDNTIKKYDNNKKIYLRMCMTRFLKTGKKEELVIEEKYRSSLTAFDFEVDDSVIEKELTSEENNLVRLSCHVMLKAEWKEWNH